ncbi:CBO0543 family protein [Halalkalibacter alkalisediminis]|uniref:CBO0543 family protein n=1 Tax=Halalkalibacter alkalisediminis TaxID=935616 RepID=A0ABV6NNH0_9BACI|nr:CBO0543 family protein [Halalkalibacter alkalisediminis]
MQLERFIIKFGIFFGLLSTVTLFKKPSVKSWLPLYSLKCFTHYIFDKILVETKQVKYPIRFLPKVFKINVIYDFLVCPYLSIWYCQSTYNSKLQDVLGKLILFAIPQALYEVTLERKTKALQFKGNWKWIYSFYLVFVVKIISRGLLGLFKRTYVNP